MRELVEYIAQSLVDHPDQVRVNQVRRGSVIEVHLQVAKEDMGRVIGKDGKVANAMRLLLRVAAAREAKRVSLDILEPR